MQLLTVEWILSSVQQLLCEWIEIGGILFVMMMNMDTLAGEVNKVIRSIGEIGWCSFQTFTAQH